MLIVLQSAFLAFPSQKKINRHIVISSCLVSFKVFYSFSVIIFIKLLIKMWYGKFFLNKIKVRNGFIRLTSSITGKLFKMVTTFIPCHIARCVRLRITSCSHFVYSMAELFKLVSFDI